jgi:hypothetical protein
MVAIVIMMTIMKMIITMMTIIIYLLLMLSAAGPFAFFNWSLNFINSTSRPLIFSSIADTLLLIDVDASPTDEIGMNVRLIVRDELWVGTI